MTYKMSEQLKKSILEGFANQPGSPLCLKGKNPYLKFDEIVIKRVGPSYWTAEVRWKGESILEVAESLFVAEGGSISFKCFTGRLPFTLKD